MISGAIEALYMFNSASHEPILDHVYRSRPPPSQVLLHQYLQHPSPRPSVQHLANVTPPSTLFSLSHANVLFLVPASVDTEPLMVLEFLQRLVDVLEEFLGPPLLASKIETSYDVVAQLLGEMVDAGIVSTTEPNALREAVNTPGWMDKLLGGVGLPGSTPTAGPSNPLQAQLALQSRNQGPAIPWRRPNVKHTSNELYVDIIESLSVTLAPSGRPLAAFAYGSVLFTAKISGVPDLVLNLSVPGGGRQGLGRILELPTFHPCVRLARWRDHPGELSFVPPDGKFMLAGYQVNLLPPPSTDPSTSNPPTIRSLDLPALVEVDTCLGPNGNEFEVRLLLNQPGSSTSSSSSSLSPSTTTTASAYTRPSAAASLRQAATSSSSGRSTPTGFFGMGSSTASSASSAAPSLYDVEVTVPIPAAVRSINDLRASRGEAVFSQLESEVSWTLPAKHAASSGVATLRCTVVGPLGSGALAEVPEEQLPYDAAQGEYVAEEDLAYQPSSPTKVRGGGGGGGGGGGEGRAVKTKDKGGGTDAARAALNKALMPRSASVSFGVKGWLPSGIRVESLNIDAQRSRGLGEGVRPVKGAKYLTISRKGVETRC